MYFTFPSAVKCRICNLLGTIPQLSAVIEDVSWGCVLGTWGPERKCRHVVGDKGHTCRALHAYKCVGVKVLYNGIERWNIEEINALQAAINKGRKLEFLKTYRLNGRTDGQTDRQTDRQENRQAHTHYTCISLVIFSHIDIFAWRVHIKQVSQLLHVNFNIGHSHHKLCLMLVFLVNGCLVSIKRFLKTFMQSFA